MRASDLFHRAVDILADVEKRMSRAADMMTAMIGTEVYAIRAWGVHVGDPAWVLSHDAAEIVSFNDDCYPYKANVMIDGIRYFALMDDETYRELAKEADSGTDS